MPDRPDLEAEIEYDIVLGPVPPGNVRHMVAVDRARLADLEARAAALERELGAAREALDNLTMEYIDFQRISAESVDELRAALKKYGVHKNRCAMFPYSMANPVPCDCGLAAALGPQGAPGEG